MKDKIYFRNFKWIKGIIESSAIDNFKTQFGKEVTFRQVYHLLKAEKAIHFQQEIPQ